MRHSIRPDILMASGHYFDFVDPRWNTVLIEDIAAGLAKCCRFAGQTSTFYSVAQHSIYVSFLVPPEDAMAGLLHDAAEAYLGDVTRPLKQLLPEFKAIEKRVEADIFEKMGIPYPLPDSVKKADLIMLATEQRDLMPPHDDEWTLIAEVTPMPNPIIPLPWDRAMKAFIDRYHELLARQGATP